MSININSMMSRAVFPNSNERMLSGGGVSGGGEVEEESGWTMYFDDFFNEYNNDINRDDRHENCSSMISIGDHHHHHHLETSLMISDAASSAAKKFADDDHEHKQQAMGVSLCGRSPSSSFKKRKTKLALINGDGDLEDTASSPANSPKLSLMNQFDRKPHQKHSMDMSQEEKGSTSRNLQKEERSGFGSNKGSSELKKKGLCLVPLSTIVNYLD